jgi:hypothetical protein
LTLLTEHLLHLQHLPVAVTGFVCVCFLIGNFSPQNLFTLVCQWQYSAQQEAESCHRNEIVTGGLCVQNM